MDMWGIFIALVLGAYLLASIPFGLVVGRRIRGLDITKVGSGNIGATNVARVLGKKWFLIVYLLDFLKGLLPCLVVGLLTDHKWGRPAAFAVVLCGLLAVGGHIWPVYLRFRGGKGVATSCGVCMYLFPWALLAGFVAWVIVAAIWRYVSLASVTAAFAVPVALIAFRQPLPYLVLFSPIALLIILRHLPNIRRLLAGTEPKIGRPKPADSPSPIATEESG